MIRAKYDWIINEKKPDDGFFKLAKKKGLSEDTSRLLFERGIDDEGKLDHFLRADLSNLHDPYLLNDMEKAVTRIRTAIENYEQILVYGDYDADGMTSASIIKESLEMMGAEALIYLPNRFTDGYGPNQSVYKYFIEQNQVSLIITVDNGVAGHEAIAYAQAAGVDVIVTDHHSLPEQLPQAFAVIHPEHPDADYPFKKLAGCGVAFKLACALLESVPTEFLDLVAIGTIADMVSLTDENRVLVKNGLQVLKNSERQGLQELMTISGVDFGSIDEDTVGFKIAPQLNALGRLDDPNPAIELLTGFDDEEAHDIALMINEKNEERKVLVQTIYKEAVQMVDPNKPVQVIAKAGWHPGVLGIVAGRILEELSQTVIVLNIENGVAKGSARSIEALNIFDALNHKPELMTVFGGHSGAAGMTLPAKNIQALSDSLCDFVLSEKIDSWLELNHLSLDFLKELKVLAPFGMDNKKPVFALKDFSLVQARTMGADQSHLKLRIKNGSVETDVVAFNQGQYSQEFSQLSDLQLAVTLSVNSWNGNTSLQLMLVDARATQSPQLFDFRARNMTLPAHVSDVMDESGAQEVAIIDLPEDLAALRQQFQNKNFEAIYFKNVIQKPYYLSGFGSKEQFARLYKTIYQFPEFDVRYKLGQLSEYLKIDSNLLVKMIQIFNELGFVTIDNGLMTVNKEAAKRDIADSETYQELRKLVKYQELMALGTPREIYDFLVNRE